MAMTKAALDRDRQYRRSHLEICHAAQHRYYQSHRDAILEKHRLWRRANALEILSKLHIVRDEIKLRVFSHYRNGDLKCAICREDRIAVLSVDHIDGGGSAHRKSLGNQSFYRWLEKQGYPSGYQVLCMNCRFIKKAEESRRRRDISLAEVANRR
jgi:hypothetical protein